MVYVVCEDSKSGYQFWSSVAEEFCGKDVEITTSYGCKGLISKVSELGIKRGDCLILCYDYATNVELKRALNIIEEMQKDIGFKTIKTNYTCFEQMFLTFDRLVEFVGNNCDSTKISELANKIACEKIDGDTFDRLINTEYSGLVKTDCTLEQSYSDLLTKITSMSKRRLRVTKSKVGDCWLKECNDIDMYDYSVHCKNCIYNKEKCNSRRNKLRYFEKHSNLNGGIYDFEHWIQFIENG